MTLGRNIYEERKKLGLSQELFASRLNVARQTVSSWERDVSIPDISNLIEMAGMFNCKIDDIINPPQPLTGKKASRTRAQKGASVGV